MLVVQRCSTVCRGSGAAVQHRLQRQWSESKLRRGDEEQSQALSLKSSESLKVDVPFVHTTRFKLCIGGVILLNAIFMGVQIDYMPENVKLQDRLEWYFIENCFLLVYVFEMCSRLYFERMSYFQDGWNLLDFTLVTLAVLDTWVMETVRAVNSSEEGGKVNLRLLSTLRIARMLRLVRLVRLLRVFKELWLIVEGFVKSLSTLGWVTLLLFLFIYICAILTTMMLGQPARESNNAYLDDLFGYVPRSMFTLFTALTLDGWSNDISRPVMEKDPLFSLFFIFFLMVTTFGLLNIVVGVIVENTLTLSKGNEETLRKRAEKEEQRILASLHQLFSRVDVSNDGHLTQEEFREALKDGLIRRRLHQLHLPADEVEQLFHMLDRDGDGMLSVSEFVGGILKVKRDVRTKDAIHTFVMARSALKRLTKVTETFDAFMQGIDSLEAAISGANPYTRQRSFTRFRGRSTLGDRQGSQTRVTPSERNNHPSAPSPRRDGADNSENDRDDLAAGSKVGASHAHIEALGFSPPIVSLPGSLVHPTPTMTTQQRPQPQREQQQQQQQQQHTASVASVGRGSVPQDNGLYAGGGGGVSRAPRLGSWGGRLTGRQ
ncbi:unnamed protein product [Vitrella brassicaformis CCMP3155]|uniref:EF-hand domain-containing protein n=3 Tax=Vitrella brassicaformis TaxID=1169539 RepID=A0A0G4GLH0_VITBC|nr:unnamed protein product [Vitrella brassicaformis CCMP3155]|eukprot:CEM30911.1 unnamed protein product [Vitrella brassicaformis CCMP3155]